MYNAMNPIYIEYILLLHLCRQIRLHKIFRKVVSADVQGKQDNWPYLRDSGDFKAATILGICVCRTQRVHVMFRKI